MVLIRRSPRHHWLAFFGRLLPTDEFEGSEASQRSTFDESSRRCKVAYAVVIQVKLDPNSDVEHRHAVLTDYVIPEAKALPGFQMGMRMNDGFGTGTCTIVFDTEDDAA